MKIYIWESVKQSSDNYHSGGGVVVFAENEERARQLANNVDGCDIKIDEKPTHIRNCENGEELVFVMPDAGCC